MMKIFAFSIGDVNVHIFSTINILSSGMLQYSKYPPIDNAIENLDIYIVFDEFKIQESEYIELYRGTTYFWGKKRNSGEMCFAFSTRYEETCSFEEDDKVWYACTTEAFDRVVLHINKTWLYKEDLVDELLSRPWIQRIVVEKLAKSNMLILHGGASIVRGNHVALLGDSGAGKSTICKNIARTGNAILADDRITLSVADCIEINGTPWNIKNPHFSNNMAGVVSGIFFLKHGDYNEIERIDNHVATKLLMKQVYQPLTINRQEVLMKVFLLCRQICNRIPCYEFSFFPSVRVVEEIEKVLI